MRAGPQIRSHPIIAYLRLRCNLISGQLRKTKPVSVRVDRRLEDGPTHR